MNLIFSKLQVSTYICFFGLFVAGSIIRYGLISNSILQQYSLLVYVGMLLIYIYSSNYLTKEYVYKSKFNSNVLFVYILLILLAAMVILFSEDKASKLKSVIIAILPIICVAFRLRDRIEFDDVFKIWIAFLHFSVILMVVTEILDLFTGYAFTNFFANFSGVSSLLRIANQKRCVTYMGHPLYSCEIFLIYYLFKHLDNEIKNKKENIIDFILPLVGIALAQGRTAAVLIILAYGLFNLKKNSYRYLLLGVALMYFGYQLGLFDSIIDRFVNAILMGDISSGRNTSLMALLESDALNFSLLSGRESFDSSQVSTLSMALEYPILGWCYNYGIIMALTLCVILFIYPLTTFLKRKQFTVFWVCLFIILDVNSYAGLSSSGMRPYVFYIACSILLNCSDIFYYDSKDQLLGGAEI